MAAFEGHEPKRTSQQTKDSITAQKVRVEAGTDKGGQTVWREALGVGPANLSPNIKERQQSANIFALKMRREIDGMKADEVSQRQIIKELNRNKHKTATGKAGGAQTQLQQVIARPWRPAARHQVKQVRDVFVKSKKCKNFLLNLNLVVFKLFLDLISI